MQPTESRHARSVALATILTATFLTALNSSMVRVATPMMQETFGTSYSWLTWVQNGYTLVYAVLMPVAGRLGDMYGRRRIFLFGVCVFTLGSILCTFTWSFASLIVFRAIQAIGSGAVFPNAVIMATSLYSPEERGRILGLWGAVGSVGSVIGPSLGGFLVEFLDWRSVFYVNIPIGILVFFAATARLKESELKQKRPFDLAGASMFGLTVLSFLLALNIGNDFGWMGWQVWSLAAAGCLLTLIFVRQENRCTDPMIHLDLLTSKAFLVAVVCGMIHMYAGQTVGFLMPLFLVNIQGYGAAVMGLMLLPSALVRVFVSPYSGSLSDKYGARLPAGLGMCALVVTFLLLARLHQTSSAWYIGVCLLLNGAGGGLMQSPVLNSVIGSRDSSESGVVSGLFNMTRFVGGMIGTAVAGIQVGDEMAASGAVMPGPISGFYEAFMTASVLAAIGFFVSRRLADPHTRAIPAPRATAEDASGVTGRI